MIFFFSLSLSSGIATVFSYVLCDDSYGLIQQNMATDEFQILQNNKSAIINRVAHQTNPGWFSLKLQEKGMISAENASAIVNSSSLSNEVKVDRLIQAVESMLRYGPNPAQLFQEFVMILQSEPSLKDLAQKLQTG